MVSVIRQMQVGKRRQDDTQNDGDDYLEVEAFVYFNHRLSVL